VRVMVTGGAGYIGSVLCPLLADAGYQVLVIDNFDYGLYIDNIARPMKIIRKDIRDLHVKDFEGCDAVIHLACISNDPCMELDPKLGKEVNYDCFPDIVRNAKLAGVNRFIYASTSAVYGITPDDTDVDETWEPKPITDYAKYKYLCEPILLDNAGPDLCATVVRPVTICGVSPRMRFDVVVNMLTNQAINTGKIKVLGTGKQMRGNMHILDMCRCYMQLLKEPESKINGEIFNVGLENYTILQLAQVVRDIVGEHVEIYLEPDTDPRSYHLNADKIKKQLGFKPQYTINRAIKDIVQVFNDGWYPDSMNDPRYYNIKMMKQKNEREAE